MSAIPNPTKQNSPVCPSCDSPIAVQPKYCKGDVLECSACGTESEIISENPLIIAPLEEEK
jgi:hypothetical protein